MSGVGNLQEMLVCDIANVIARNWKKVHYAANPYLQAMRYMGKVTDRYGMDDGEGIINRFLSNAGSWRGEVAREVKAELRRRLKDANVSSVS